MLDDPLYATHDARRDNVVSARVHIAEQMLKRPTEEWLRLFKTESIPVQAVRSLAEAVADPQLEHRGIKVRAEGVVGLEQPITLIGAPFVTNEDGPMTTARPPGKVGEHTVEILTEMGYSPADIDQILSSHAGS